MAGMTVGPLLLLVVALVLARTYAQPIFACCTPKVWNSVVRTLRVFVEETAAVRNHQIWQKVNYDANNQRVSVVTYKDNEQDCYLRQVLDYAAGERYVIHGEEEQKCVRHPLSRPFLGACIPGNTTSVYFARIGDSTQSSSPGLWENTAYYSQENVSGYTTVTLVDCAMVVEVAYGHLDRGLLSHNIQYLNQTLHVIDPASFHIPDNCSTDPVELREEPWQQFSMLGKLI